MKIPRALRLAISLLLISPAAAARNEVAKLSPEDAAQLQRDKVIITGKTWRQVFEPYIYSPAPVFITSDSLLNAWFVLLEETGAALEDRFAAQLPRALERALENIKDPPEGMSRDLFNKAARHARIVAGIAAKLSGSQRSGGDLDGVIAAEVKRVEAATGLYLPEWLKADGQDIAALDYTVFKPVSYYTRSPRLSRYFRAVRWMQTIPFRPERDEELAAFALLQSGLAETRTLLSMSHTHEFLTGVPSDVDVQPFERMLQRQSGVGINLADWREEALDRLARSTKDHPAAKRRLVLFSARALPDRELFLRMTSAKRPLPSGLDTGVALGSETAAGLLGKQAGSELLKTVTEWKTNRHRGDGLYDQCFDNLGLLLTAPEPNAPAFMNTEVWRLKSLNTALGGWAQLRHASALQGKEDAHWMGTGDASPGFVEPAPEFFRQMSLLAGRCMDEFGKLDVLETGATHFEEQAKEILPEAEVVVVQINERLKKLNQKYKEGQKLTDEESDAMLKEHGEATKGPPVFMEALTPMAFALHGTIPQSFPPVTAESISRPDDFLTHLRDIAGGKRTQEITDILQKYPPASLRDRWAQLLEICHRLETLAHKQLRGVEPEQDEVKFIRGYGPRLARVMFYDGNSWLHPNDDAPRITSVFNQPGVAHLLAGVARPREIRVLYPWKGKEIECHGAVMPYCEFLSDKHLTDAEWKEKLDAKDAPQAPDWMKPLMSAGPPVPQDK